MIKIENTRQLAGVIISGDFHDLDQLVEAFYDITIDEFTENKKEIPYIETSTRVLGLCYEVRHAAMGTRDSFKKESGLAEEENTYHSCTYYYPEMFFIMMALDDLVKLRMKTLAKKQYLLDESLKPRLAWDETIAVIRSFQAAFSQNMMRTWSKPMYSRWLNLMDRGYYDHCLTMFTQYIDKLNVDYLELSREQREKKLSSFAKRVIEYEKDSDYRGIETAVREGMQEYGCAASDLRIPGLEYPDDIDW